MDDPRNLRLRRDKKKLNEALRNLRMAHYLNGSKFAICQHELMTADVNGSVCQTGELRFF